MFDNRAIRVLHVTPAYYPATYWGGPIFSVFGLNNALANFEQVSLKVLTSDAAGPRISNRVGGCKPGPSIYPPGYEVFFCKRLIGREFAPAIIFKLIMLANWADVIHVTGTYSFVTLPSLLAARLFGKPIVWSPRGALQASADWNDVRRRRLKRMWETVCDRVVRNVRCTMHVTSDAERFASTLLIPSAASAVIRNGVDIPDNALLENRNWSPDEKLRLIFLGRIEKVKGIENLIDGLGHLNDHTITLDICGTGDASYVASIRERVARRALGDRVFFHGQVDGAAKTNALTSADLCVVPSHSENFCMVVAEALAHGVPVIASKGTPWQAVEEHECGLWVENSPTSLANAICTMRRLPLAHMGALGRAWMIRDFSWNSVAEEMLGLYLQVSAPNKNG